MRKSEIIRNGLYYDSPDEVYFAMWLDELQEAGFIKTWTRDTESIVVTEPLVVTWEEVVVMKTKTKVTEKHKTILSGTKYNPDFIIDWNGPAFNQFCQTLKNEKVFAPMYCQFLNGGFQSYIEIKPEFDRHNMTRAFKLNQNIIWDKYKIFINIVNVFDLFAKTFTPKEYLLTPTGKERKISKWTVKTLNEFTNGNTN